MSNTAALNFSKFIKTLNLIGNIDHKISSTKFLCSVSLLLFTYLILTQLKSKSSICRLWKKKTLAARSNIPQRHFNFASWTCKLAIGNSCNNVVAKHFIRENAHNPHNTGNVLDYGLYDQRTHLLGSFASLHS